MSQYFITHCEPLHPQKGKEVVFFVREQDQGKSKSHVVIREIPHLFFTTNFSREQEAEGMTLLSQLQQDPHLAHFSFSREEYDRYHFFLRAEGSKEDAHLLLPPFLCNGASQDPCRLNSPTQLLRWLYPPGMLISSLQDIPLPQDIKKREYASIESLVQENYAVIDIELENWEIGEDHVFMVMYASATKKILFHDLPFDNKRQEGFRLVRFSSPQDLGKRLAKIFAKEDPLWLFGHNLMNFDQMKLRDLTGTYLIAVDQHYPVKKGSQGLGKVLTKGRFTLDSRLYNTNYQAVRADNKLETVTDGFEKSIDYTEQAFLVRLARQGDHQAFRRLVHYGVEDIVITEDKGKEFRDLVVRKSHYFRAPPDDISSTSKLSLAQTYWDRRHFFVRGVYADTWRTWPKGVGRSGRGEENFSVDHYLSKEWKKGFSQGLFNAHLIYLTPIIAAASMCRLLEGSDRELLERGRRANSPLEKFDLYQTVNAKLAPVVEEVLTVLQRENQQLFSSNLILTKKQKYALNSWLDSHGLHRVDAQNLVYELAHSLHQGSVSLSHYIVITHGPYLSAVQGDLSGQKLEDSLHGAYLGFGLVLSLREGRFIANPWNEEEVEKLVYQGISLKKGWSKTKFEKRILPEIVRRIFGGENTASVASFLQEEVQNFVSGRADPQDYVVEVKRRTYYKNLLGEVLENSGLDLQLLEEYNTKVKPNIGERFTSETRKRLQKILNAAPKFEFIEEILENIEHPYPGKINLIYAEPWPDLLLPETFGMSLNLEKYRQKVEEQFQPFYQVLGVR